MALQSPHSWRPCARRATAGRRTGRRSPSLSPTPAMRCARWRREDAVLIIAVIASVMVVTGTGTWLLATRWPGLRMAPTIEPTDIKTEVERHPRLAAIARSRLDPASTTGLALTVALVLVVGGAVGVGVL